MEVIFTFSEILIEQMVEKIIKNNNHDIMNTFGWFYISLIGTYHDNDKSELLS